MTCTYLKDAISWLGSDNAAEINLFDAYGIDPLRRYHHLEIF